ncbi:MAG: hypothetical protein WCW43_01175, partial [Candidatus Paceibacterota bacterium]
MNNKKQVLVSYIVVTLLVSIVAFDKMFYSHKEKSVLAKKMTELIKESFATVTYVNPFSVPTTTVSTSTSSTTTPVATTTTTIVKTILPPESPVDYKDNGNGTITDNYTKLMWA